MKRKKIIILYASVGGGHYKAADGIKNYIKCLTWFSIVNFVVLIAYILFSLGVFNF